MARHSEYFELALAGFAAVLALLFQPISEHVFANALQAWLATRMQPSEAELIARLSEVIVPAAGAILLIVALQHFLEREIEREFRNEDEWLRRELTRLRADGIGLRIRGQSLKQGISEWMAECASWSDKVTQTVARISSADAETLRAPGMVPPPRIPLKGSEDPQQIKVYTEHDFHLVRLEKLIEKYSFQGQSWQRRHHTGVAQAS